MIKRTEVPNEVRYGGNARFAMWLNFTPLIKESVEIKTAVPLSPRMTSTDDTFVNWLVVNGRMGVRL